MWRAAATPPLSRKLRKNLRRKQTSRMIEVPTAENAIDFRRFSSAKPAGRNEVNWYTFESLAREFRTVRTIYYHHYKK
jgi:hypothetical protein